MCHTLVCWHVTLGMLSHASCGSGTHPAGDVLVVQLLVELPRQTKVTDLQRPVMHHQDIPGRQVTVYALGSGKVRRGEGREGEERDGRGVREGKW